MKQQPMKKHPPSGSEGRQAVQGIKHLRGLIEKKVYLRRGRPQGLSQKGGREIGPKTKSEGKGTRILKGKEFGGCRKTEKKTADRGDAK